MATAVQNSRTAQHPPAGEAPAPAVRRRRPAGVGVLTGAAAVVLTAAVYVVVARLGLPTFALVLVLLAAIPVLLVGGSLIRSGEAPAPGRYPRSVLIAPAAYYLGFFVGPVVVLVTFAFATRVGFGTIVFGASTANFSEALSGIYVQAFLRSLRFAALGTLSTVAVGFPFAYWLARHAPANRRSLLIGLVMVPFWTSFLIRAYAMTLILSDDFVLARALRRLHLVDGQLGLLYHPGGVQIGLVYGYLPLFILPLYATMERLDWSLVQAAQDLGASKARAFLSITVPLATPGLLVGGLLVFIPMVGEYIIPGVLGGGQVDLIGNVVGRAFLEQQNYPLGAAMGSLVMLALTAVIAIYIVSSIRTERHLDAA